LYIDQREFVDDFSPSEMTKFDAIAVSERADTTWLEAVRALEPELEILCWLSGGSVKDTLAGGWDPADTTTVPKLRKVKVIPDEWLLHDVDGNPITIWESPWGNNWAVNLTEHCPVDGGGDRYGTWMPRAMARRFSPGGAGATRWAGWSGIILDEMSNGMAWTESRHGNGEIDADGDGLPDDDSELNANWREEQAVMFEGLREAFGDRIFALNGDTVVLADTDGQMQEDCLHTRTWEQDMYGYSPGPSGHGGYLRNLGLSRPGENQLCVFQARFYESTPIPFEQFARLAAGSSCLGDGYYSLELWVEGEQVPVLDASVYSLDFGLPAGDLRRVSASGDTLYERAFTKAFVQVNPNATPRYGVPARDARFTFYDHPTISAVDPSTNEAVLRWAVPEIDGNPAVITGFDVRIAPFPIDEGTWDDATPLRIADHIGGWEPGDLIEATASDLVPQTGYHTASRTLFRGGQMSEVSPSVRFHTLPTRDGWAPPAGAGTAGNEFWWSGFRANAPNGIVRALLAAGGELFVAGDFNRVGSHSAQHVARWDGSAWRAVGNGTNGPVHALTSWDRFIVAGGGFSTAGSQPAGNVAAWDGGRWIALGDGFNGAVRALAVWQGQLIAAGDFSQSGPRPVGGIAAWNGTRWGPLGFGINEGLALSSVPVISEWTDGLITQGVLSRDGEPYQAIVSWRGTEWEAIGEPLTGQISALGIFEGDLIVGGAFGSIDGLAANGLARWDGIAWHPFGSGVAGEVRSLGVFGGWLVVGGAFERSGIDHAPFLARWDGTAFTALGTGMDGPVYAIAAYGGELYLGGAFARAGDQSSPFLARWTQGATTPVDPTEDPLPPPETITRVTLSPPAPNPFGAITRLEYALPASIPITLAVYDVAGQRVETLFEGTHPAGRFVVQWDGRSSTGALPPGVYFVRLEALSFTMTEKLVRAR